MTDVEEASQSRRCAVIYNPTKISDKFRAVVEEGPSKWAGATHCGWLETSVEDPGGAIGHHPRRRDPTGCPGAPRASRPRLRS
jgi:hypothetical protein